MESRRIDHASNYSVFTRRLVRFVMRGARIVEGNIHVTEGQSLAVFLQTRRNIASLTEARWIGPGMQVVPHMAFRTDKILWACSLDDAFPVAGGARAVPNPRWAELTLDDGTIMHVGMYLADEQRLTDYFEATPPFLPVMQATVVGSGRLLGPVAVNTSAILAVREIEKLA
jgi:hypothetical protein